MNFVFISPHFPHTYWNFCERLRRSGVNVLGIGDAPYDTLESGLRFALTEYYRVDSLEDYDQVYRAVAFFAFKYGKIDWLESNNEYWLEQDARLRTDFHITTGVDSKEVAAFKSKSGMKAFYAKAGVPTARCQKVTTLAAAKRFLTKVGYPVIVKPDNGVGAAATSKIADEQALAAFFNDLPAVPYVMEEFVEGDLFSYDAIIDSRCDPLFESAAFFPVQVMDSVNDQLDFGYYVLSELPPALAEAGRATVRAFGARSRFVHLEFFRLRKAKKDLGKKGDFVGLEVNMRPAGGYSPDMMNYAHSTDVYQIWADMVASDSRLLPPPESEQVCVYAARRDCHQYRYSEREIAVRYGGIIVMQERMPDIWQGAMGNQMYMAKVPDETAAQEFIRFIQEKA